MRRVLLVSAVAALAVAAVSCGDDDDDAAPATSSPIATPAAPATSASTDATTTETSSPDDGTATSGSGTSESATTEPAPTAPAEVVTVRFAVNPGQLAWLPYFVAVEKGYFEQEGLDVQVAQHNQGVASQYPLLARGDLDIVPAVPAPPLFNLKAEGFSVKLVGATSAARDGYLSNTVMMVRSDLADEITTFEDLAGRTIDGAAEGSNGDFIVKNALANGGLTPEDATLTYTGRTPPDMVQNLASGAVDVQSVVEPFATQAEADGVGVKLFTTNDVTPGFQEAFVAVSEDFVAEQPEAIVRFLRAMQLAIADIDAAGGDWTDELVEIASKWTTLPPELIRSLGRTPYFPPDMEIDVESFTGAQQFYVDDGLVAEPVDPAELIDPSFLEQAGS